MSTASTKPIGSITTLVVAVLALGASAQASSFVTVTTGKDSTTVLHNPMMGLTSYSGDFAGDYRVLPYTNIFYIRRTWTTFEPTEGNYVWINDAGWKALFKAAKDRGFRLAFRVMVQDDWGSPQKHGTPQYVWDAIRAAGQDSLMRGGNPNGTYIDVTNAIWQQKFKTFILAMGKAFDDPSITDYIDVSALGGSGEGNPWQEGFADVEHAQSAYMDWHVGIYDQAFKKVVLNYNMPWNPDISLKYGLSFRRDGLGSGYVDSSQIKIMQQQNLSTTALLGEYCYSFNGAQDSATGWGTDPLIINFALPGKPTLATAIDLALSQGFAMHANTLNLSDFDWFPRLPDRLARLIANLGYRLRPKIVQYPDQTESQDSMVVQHTWVNDAVGALPNDNSRWNRKYAVAFALFKNGESVPTKIVIDSATNPGVFVKGTETNYSTKIRWNVRGGAYKLGVGIIDKTRPNDSSLALALAKPTKRSGWYVLGDLAITDKVIPSTLISKNKPVFASPTTGAGTLVNGGFGTSDWKLDANSWAAIHLGTGPQKIMVLWSQSATNWSDSAYPSQRCAEGFGVFSKYDILTSANSTNGADGDWTLQTSVSRNIASARSHLVDFAGQSWVKIRATSGAGSLDEIQVFDATNAPNDGVFMIGTSITAISERQFPADSSVADMIHARDPRISPPIINGGVVCIGSWEVVAGLSNYLAMSTPLRYWAIELGTNDGWGGGGTAYALTTYAHDLQTIIDSAKNHGIVPILARPPATNPAYTAGGPWQLDPGFARAVDSLRVLNHLQMGPDFYNYFLAHPTGISGDGVHPNQEGSLAIRRLWADAIVAADNYGAPPAAISSSPRMAAKSRSRILSNRLLEITSQTIGPIDVTILSLTGRQSHHLVVQAIAKQPTTIDLNPLSLKSGIYLVRVQTNTGSETIKWAKGG